MQPRPDRSIPFLSLAIAIILVGLCYSIGDATPLRQREPVLPRDLTPGTEPPTVTPETPPPTSTPIFRPPQPVIDPPTEKPINTPILTPITPATFTPTATSTPAFKAPGPAVSTAQPTPPATFVAEGEPCSGHFVPYDLLHTTTVESGVMDAFAGLGAGVAVGDLDNDGDLDVVLGGYSGANSLLWNEGGLRFRWEALGDGATRAVNIVDVDGDGWLDIVFTRHNGALTWLRNLGATAAPAAIDHAAQFALGELAGVTSPAFAMAWGDLNNDGDLDLVTASNTTPSSEGNVTAAPAGPAGVIVYDNDGLNFTPTVLTATTSALAIGLFDFNHDGRLDILVGNADAASSQAWSNGNDGWHVTTPFATAPHSTAGFTWDDINNRGAAELLTTGPAVGDAGAPNAGNTLQLRTGLGSYNDQAAGWGVVDTGWSWSGQFGDFDNDGLLDLYIVNGMIDRHRFAALPGGALVEANQAFHNMDSQSFAPAPNWQLGSTRSGRGMVIADLDNDGDLDIVVNNLAEPAQLFENRLCHEDYLEVDLLWPQSLNTRGIGAQLTLTADSATYQRDVRVATGYLSGDPSRVHFGFPVDAHLQRLTVRWPDGLLTTVEQLAHNTFVKVEYDSSNHLRRLQSGP